MQNALLVSYLLAALQMHRVRHALQRSADQLPPETETSFGLRRLQCLGRP